MNTETKRHIDTARQVLVGVVPNPTSQIDQITNALIYKFMDDMDQSAIKAGGKPSFFVGNLEKYAWTRLMDARMGNQERMNIYSEALVKFSEAKQLPELFRNIFKSAFLPYRNPETLGLFLKEIDYFDYSHPEELGNAYEYLLSIMSSQGDAGQFRTPRHIIDFIVEVVNPTKDDKLLDPACGTGGFLVSAYNHIIRQHDGKGDDGSKNDEKPLSPDDRRKLMNNFVGYDIDPGMARIAQVNMYLHQFKNPKILQYDTLSMEERWGEKFDVILANPPFMSPKGGIKPHSKFSVKSSRSEVLFVDYIMSHLRPKGRAGIIVPEGIIFQSGTAYKQLRKNLVEDGLYSVVSLPGGVFNPYAGVKTSILFFDNQVAKNTDKILFIKVEADGFELGAQRRPNGKDDLPKALEILQKWREAVNNGNLPKIEAVTSSETMAKAVKKSKIAESGDYNLSGERYGKDVVLYVSTMNLKLTLGRPTITISKQKWPKVELREICEVSTGNSAPQDKSLFQDGKYPFYRTSDVGAAHLSDDLKCVRDWLNDNGIKGLKLYKKGTILFPKSGASTFLNHRAIMGFDGYVSSHLAAITPRQGYAMSKFIYYILIGIDARQIINNQAYPSIKTSEIANIKIPLPPIGVQEKIVAELDSYKKLIDGGRQVVENWKPRIDIDPEWRKIELGRIGKVSMCKRIFKEQTTVEGEIPFYKIGTFGKKPDAFISREIFNDYTSRFSYPQKGEILISTSGTIGKTVVFDGEPAYFQDSNIVWISNDESVAYNSYLNLVFQDINWVTTKGGTIERLYNKLIEETKIHVPSLEIQKQIVKKIEAERFLVEGNTKLIEIYEQKMKEIIAKLWDK